MIFTTKINFALKHNQSNNTAKCKVSKNYKLKPLF